MMSAHAVDMDDEDGRCLLDVICDPQALNDFLHGSDQLDGEDLLDTTADPASAFFTDASLNVQDAAVNHLSSGHPQSTSSAVDLDFLEDDILGPSSSSNLQNSDQPCDILQQSLQEANITEQSLEEDADLDITSLHFPSLQPASQAGDGGQLFPNSADLIGLQQPPAVLAQQALIQQQTISGQVVNKAINIQPFLQQVGLGNVTLQPVSNLQGLPNGSPSGALGLGQIQVVGQLSSQPVMAINQPAQQIITKTGQPTQVTTVPGISYISSPASDQQQVALSSAGLSPPNAGLVLQKNTAPAALNGNSLFGGSLGHAGPRPTSAAAMMQAQLSAPNVIVQRMPTPIQPRPATGVVQHKLFQISSKSFAAAAGAALAIQGEAPPQPKAQQNVTFMAGKPGQNVVFSAAGTGFPQTISSSVFKQHQAPQPAFGKPLSLHLQGGSIVIQPQNVHQAMLQSQNQFLLQGQLSGASSVPLPQQLSALQPGMAGQILATQPAGAQPNATHIIANQALPAQILANQNLAGQLNLGQVIAAQNAHGATHILSAPIQLQPGAVGQPALFQMPVSLAGSLSSQSPASVQGSLGTSGVSQSAVVQGVTLPSQSTMLGAGESQAAGMQLPPASSAQPGPGSGLVALGNGQTSLLTVQSAGASQSQAGNGTPAPASKIVIAQQGSAVAQDNAQVFFQQEQKQQQLYQAALKLQQERGLNQPSPHSLAPTVTTSSVPASVIVSSSVGLAAAGPPDSKGQTVPPALPGSHFQQTLAGQMVAGQQKTPLQQGTPTAQSPVPQAPASDPQLHIQMPSPHQPQRPPSQPQPLSRPPSRPQSRPPSQPQALSRPPSEPLSRSCTPSQLPLQPLYVIQTPLQSSPHGGSQAPHPMRPPSQPHLQMQFQNTGQHPAEAQLTPPAQSQAEAPTPPHLLPPSTAPSQTPSDPMPPQPHMQLQLHCQPHPQAPLQPVYQTLTLTPELQQRFQIVTSQLQTMSTISNPTQQHKAIMEKLQQRQHSIILQAKPSASSPAVPGVSSQGSTMLIGSQTQTLSNSAGQKSQPPGAGQAALATLLQQTSVLVKASSAGTTTTTRSPDSKVVSGAGSGVTCHLQQGPTVPLQMKPLAQHQIQPSLQMESKLGGLKTPAPLQPAKESVLVDRLRMDQDAVLQPDYKTPFRSYQDMVHRLLPYHLYQGTLPSAEEHRKVDEEFEAVSTQLLKRTQAMLHKYRMLLFEEARRLSPSAEMVMIDRMFIQEEKTSLTTDKQLAKEKPDEYVASSSRSHGVAASSPPPPCTSSTVSLEASRLPSIQTATPIHPTKLVIKHAGGSPSVSWARVMPAQDGEDDTLHARSRPPPMKTYEARSRIGLKLKIKQEAGLSKVVHNTALDPIHQASSSVIKSTECSGVASERQVNGSLDHATTPSPTHSHPPSAPNYCKLPPRKTYQDGASPVPADQIAVNPSQPIKSEDSRRVSLPKCEVTSKSVIATCKPSESPKLRTGRVRMEDRSKAPALGKKARTHAHPPPPKSEEPPGRRADGSSGGLARELSGVENELMRGLIKADPPDGSWELALPPPKRTKSESFDMDNASFSSDSPQDDTLTEHLQSAIDSILNLRQPQSSLAPNPVSSPYGSSEMNSSPFSPTPHSDSYLAPNRNGGLGARTYTR